VIDDRGDSDSADGEPQPSPFDMGRSENAGSNGAGKSRSGRRRGSRGGVRHRKKAGAATEDVEEPPVAAEEAAKGEAKPKRKRGSRGGARRKKKTEAAAEPPAEEPVAETAEAKPKRKRGSRGGTRHKKKTETAEQPAETKAEVKAKTRTRRGGRKRAEAAAQPVARTALTTARPQTPLTGAPVGEVPAPFAHPAEYEFARILDFYGIEWQYEPRSFPLRWDSGNVVEAFTPDFYLPDLNMYVEVTTLKTSLTAEKNRKMRMLKQLYPEVNIKLLKKRDYLRLLAKYGYGPMKAEQVPDIDRVLIPTTKLQHRIGELGARISLDYAGKEPVLIGVLRGVMCFMADLMRNISLPAAAVDFMAITSYEGNGSAVRIVKDLDENIKGRDVILVEDIVDTGMTLNHILEYLASKRPASLKVCALLDKQARRIANVPLEYVGFEIPDEFVVGYGLDFRQRFRNLPFIAVLKHELLP
jgi:hypoxanthine phosphoribosyltransferase